ncbi:hypothetical protein [uncultured Aquabacterium sp.]|uniref:hypothetical protein n=1 Tax=uncultured Aquabacterium sp. TaxID=158753 RepID=UPI0025E718BA|nr:hypothetical protein [uncultured Aquabacterium sp.]
MTHHITDEQIGQIAEQVGLVGPDSRVGDCHAAALRFARAVLALAAPAPQGEPYGWAVTGCHSLYRGEWAESTAKAEARRCGGTARAFPLYTAPAPAVPMSEVDLQDDDALRFAQRVLESDAPESDRKAARDMLVAIRTRVRKARAALTAVPTPPAQQVSEPEVVIPDDGPSTYEQRFTEAVALICGAEPPPELVEAWIAGEDEALQQWVGGYAPGWVQNIAVLDAAHQLANQPTEGGEHEMRSKQPAVPEDVARDAERYRWLRDNLESGWAICEWQDDPDGLSYYRDARAPEVVDAAIDAARAAEKGGA